jgi:hypothetical protein
VGIKQLVIATWLATALLIVASTPQSGQQSSTNGTYDPWLDYNEDGKIDAADLSLLGQAYGASGEPTKNVTVVGHLTKLVRAAVEVSLPPLASWDSDLIWIDGYAKVSILISLQPSSSNKLQVYTYDSTGLSGPSWIIEQVNNMGNYWTKTFDVMNQQIRINLGNTSTTDTCTLNVDVYLMA